MHWRSRAPAAMLVMVIAALCGCKGKQPAAPQQAKPSPTPSPILAVQEMPGSAFKMSLSINPPQPKFASKTTFRVKITDSSRAPVSGADAAADLVMPLMDMGKNHFPLKDVGGGNYEGAGEFGMAGEWEVNVTASGGGKTGKYRFNVNVIE